MADRLSYHLDLSADDRAAVLALPCVVKTMDRTEYIVRDGEKPTHSCVMLKGYSVRTKIAGNGNRQIIAVHMKGDLVDLQNSFLRRADHGVQMLTRATVAMIPRENIVRLAAERPIVGQAMWMDTLVEGSIAREWIMNVGQRDARTRIAHLLCEFSLRLKLAGLGEEDRYELPMTQEQLADTTGLTPVHVNRMLKGLEKDGLINRPTPRSIRIGNLPELAKVGDFDTNYLHLREDDQMLH
ncbi:MAG TPA: Crp/Fnr family transcriptional regulator [Sphingomicrobium sp.]|jgi:CRP-like cAMP-binding protein|nr:Crp/Fnr family transcriptional regulator [Sphingomicrobium sp.]